MRRTSYHLIIAILTITATSAMARPVISQNEYTYPISGSNADELRAQMDVSGPEIEGNRFNASTEYFVNWEFQLDETETGCQIANQQVMLTTTYHFPDWQDYPTSTSAMQNDWNSFISHLRQHEQGHGKHGIQAANEVESMLTSLPIMENCAALESIANEKAYKIISRFKAVDIAYDKITHHGANQTYT